MRLELCNMYYAYTDQHMYVLVCLYINRNICLFCACEYCFKLTINSGCNEAAFIITTMARKTARVCAYFKKVWMNLLIVECDVIWICGEKAGETACVIDGTTVGTNTSDRTAIGVQPFALN